MKGIEALHRNDVPFHYISVLTADAMVQTERMYRFFRDHGIHDVGFNVEEQEGIQTSSSMQGADMERKYRDFLRAFWRLSEQDGYPVVLREFQQVISLIQGNDIIIDAKSGVSGAGRNPKLMAHYPECNESLSPYNVGRHRHTPEIEQIIGRHAKAQPEVIFTPQLAPMDRGILATIYVKPVSGVTEKHINDAWQQSYGEEHFVRLVDHLPGTKDTVDTNFCDLTARLVRGRIILISCLDNLVKGAAGAAGSTGAAGAETGAADGSFLLPGASPGASGADAILQRRAADRATPAVVPGS